MTVRETINKIKKELDKDNSIYFLQRYKNIQGRAPSFDTYHELRRYQEEKKGVK